MAKRGQNEGSITKRKDGRWAAYMTLPGTAGKRKYFYGKTRAAVQERLTEALRNSQLGLPVMNDKITFGQYLDRWLEDSVKPGVRPRTYIRYSGDVRNHLKPALGNIKLSKLSAPDIQSMLNGKLKSGLSPRTVRHLYATTRRALEVAALRAGQIDRPIGVAGRAEQGDEAIRKGPGRALPELELGEVEAEGTGGRPPRPRTHRSCARSRRATRSTKRATSR